MSTLRYFMWQWQHIFQDSAAQLARRFLDPLDPQLGPDAFLVGFRVADEAQGSEPVCVSPENCRFRPELFDNVSERTERLVEEQPQLTWRCSAPSDPETYQHAAVHRSLRLAVEQILAEAEPASAFFASEPTFVNGYSVLVVVRVDRARYDSHCRLRRDVVQKGQMTYPVGRSLIETTVRSFLDALADALQKPEPGKNVFLIRDHSAVRRTAAERLMRGPAWAGGDQMGLGDIYEICNTISRQKYEGVEGTGQLLFVRAEHPSVKIELRLGNPVRIQDCGAIRKLLQMASGKLCLLCNSRDVYGLGTVEGYDGEAEDLFEVRFRKHFTWELVHAGHVMMHCRDGSPQLQPPGPACEPIREALQRVFPGKKVEHLVELGMSIAGQPHGAMLVVTPSAADEAVRLAKQATVIEPIALTPELIGLVTKIDGAVLIDLDGTCHAIGVILDGLAHDRCTSTRGARYNSGVRYAYHREDRVVLVKSEDGVVNVLPEPDRVRARGGSAPPSAPPTGSPEG
jgi:hypothetical protein